MADIDPSLLLSESEFEALEPADQSAYLRLLSDADNAWELTGRQLLADRLADEVKELLYGGAAGGGKSEWILHRAWRKSREVPGHRTLILRTSFPELRRSIIARSVVLYGTHTPADEMPRYKSSEKEWHFPNGSVIEFGYCVAGATLIAMGDGSFKRMDEIQVGEFVDTLEGPRRVNKHFRVGAKPSVEITLPSGASVVASESHNVLLASGLWRPPSALGSGTPTARPHACTCAVSTPQTCPCAQRRHVGLRSGQQPTLAEGPNGLESNQPRSACSSLAVALHGPVAQRSALPCVHEHELCGSLTQGCQGGCSLGFCLCGAQALPWSADGPGHTPSPTGAGTRAQMTGRSDDLTSTPTHGPCLCTSYSHPYTKESRSTAVDVRQALATISQVGEQDLWDMSVDEVNHYVSYGGIVHQNCSSEEDVAQFLSAEYDMICFDEMTQFLQSQYDLIRSRARTTVQKVRRGARPHVIGATNPGQRGHGHAKSIFVDPTERGTLGAIWLVRDGDVWRRAEEDEEFDEKKARRVAFVPSTVADNPHIDPEYIANLQTMPEKLRRRYLEGDWDNPEGMFFDEWNRKRTLPNGEEVAWHVIEPFEIPASWHKVRATDYGFAAPFCTLWMAWDHDGRCYVYREAYRTRMTPREQARLVCGMQGNVEKIDRSVADPAAWANKEGISVARQWADNGFRNTKAINDRVSGWARVREYLKPSEADGYPMVQVFSDCENLIKTMPEMIHDTKKPEDLDTTLEDHAVDAFRYGLMTRPLKPRKEPNRLDRIARHFDKMTGGRKKSNQTGVWSHGV